MGPAEILKLEIEREERGAIMMDFQSQEESSGRIPSNIFILDRTRQPLEIIASAVLGILTGTLSLFIIYSVIEIMKL